MVVLCGGDNHLQGDGAGLGGERRGGEEDRGDMPAALHAELVGVGVDALSEAVGGRVAGHAAAVGELLAGADDDQPGAVVRLFSG
jgi:hypothetical protein